MASNGRRRISPQKFNKKNKMTLHKNITGDKIIAAIESDDNMGFCISCGIEIYGVEPDARACECESCGSLAVYGA